MHRLARRVLTVLNLVNLISPATSIWPFPPKRFTGNFLIEAGSMGLDPDGRVVAFGDFNGDQLSVFAIHLLALFLI